jgi:hypothetical protein
MQGNAEFMGKVSENNFLYCWKKCVVLSGMWLLFDWSGSG